MPRKGVPYGDAVCSLKERIAELEQRMASLVNTINHIAANSGDISIAADAPLNVTNDATAHKITVGVSKDNTPIIDSTALVTSGGVYAAIDALQGAVQADYVKKAGSAQTVTSQIMVPTTATGTRDTQIANGTRIQNDLDAYKQMLRTTGNQTAYGLKQIMDLAATPHMTKASNAYYRWFSVPKNATDIYCLTAAIAARAASFIDLFYIRMTDGVLTNVSKTRMCSAGINTDISLGVYTTDDSLVFCIHLNAANQYICPVMLGFHGNYGNLVTITKFDAFTASVGSDYTEVAV